MRRTNALYSSFSTCRGWRFGVNPALKVSGLGSGVAGDGLVDMVRVLARGLAELASFFGQLQGRPLPLVEALGVGPVNASLGDAVEGGHRVARTCPAAGSLGINDRRACVGLARWFVGSGEGAGEAVVANGLRQIGRFHEEWTSSAQARYAIEREIVLFT